MRPVLATSNGSCSTSASTSPSEAVPAKLSSLSGQTCYSLAAQVVGINRAQASPQQYSGSGSVVVVSLTPAELTILNSYAATHYNSGTSLAMVMFGKVLEAAPILSPQFAPALVLNGLSEGQIHHVEVALGSTTSA